MESSTIHKVGCKVKGHPEYVVDASKEVSAPHKDVGRRMRVRNRFGRIVREASSNHNKSKQMHPNSDSIVATALAMVREVRNE
jgi:hypothetical protein